MALFVVYNANGLHNTQLFPDKPRCFLQHLLNSSADFAFVLETHITPTDNPWALIPNASCMQKQRGCALIPLRPGVRFSNPHTNEEGWWITATVHTPHFPPMRMCGVYAPNSGHHEFIKKILRVAADCELILGDFNFTTWYGDSPPSPLDSEVITCLNALSIAGYTPPLDRSSPTTTYHSVSKYSLECDRGTP